MIKEKHYAPINQQEGDDAQEDGRSIKRGYPHSSVNHYRRDRLCICLSLSLLALCNAAAIALFYLHSLYDGHVPPEYAIPHRIPIEYRQFWWNTEYSDPNRTRQDELWDSILWTHGMIAMDRDWAKSQNWPETMSLPTDDSKDVYLLEAYHEVHCLGILRGYMMESLAGQDLNQPSTHTHIAHCFDYLLQVIMCNADSTPLNVFGGTVVGQGHIHKCKSWDTLRNIATENSACYKEVNGVSLDEHFEHCDDGDHMRFAYPLDLKGR